MKDPATSLEVIATEDVIYTPFSEGPIMVIWPGEMLSLRTMRTHMIGCLRDQ